MYLSDIRTLAEMAPATDLRGARVLITGLSAASGVDLSRAFADLDCQMVVQTTDLTPEVTELVALLSQSAGELKLYTTDLSHGPSAVRFAQDAAQAFGGFDVVVNLSTVDKARVDDVASDADAEALITSAIAPMAHLTRVIANRMRLVCSQGLIVNVLSMPRPATPHAASVGALARATMSAMTVDEARTWAGDGIRVNAVGPRAFLDLRAPITGACLTSEPELASLVMYLGSKQGVGMSGYVFDADGFAD